MFAAIKVIKNNPYGCERQREKQKTFFHVLSLLFAADKEEPKHDDNNGENKNFSHCLTHPRFLK
ncbi:hypothetical protein [Streptomyces mirabilis]|uniref:hypothetical protein n=1 Tax=Streptomyces mirabilis TaxID=68239 RepID=UPI003697474A